MKENAANLMKENNYNFNVLLDTNDKTRVAYKADAIPMKVVIDKNGDMVFAGYTEDIASVIENAK